MQSSLATRLILPTLLIGSTGLPLHAAVKNRITTAIADNVRTPVEHTIPARVKLSTDMGEASSDERLSAVTLYFNMTSAQQADLNQLLIDQQNPVSPQYHQWLTPQQFAARFGLSTADLGSVTSWLTSKGLTIVNVAPSNNMVTVSGTVPQIEQAFSTKIHALSYNGEDHIANITDPQLPAAIANVVNGVTGLNNFKPRSRAVVKPLYTSSQTGNHYMAPGDFYTIYDVQAVGGGSTVANNGSGISIAIAGQTDISLTDTASFRSASGLAANAPTIVKATGYVAGTVSSDIDEAQLDVEWSGAVAPAATIYYVTVGASKTASVMDALSYAITNNIAPIISISYGNCEVLWGQSSLNSINQVLQQANAQGITVIGPSGDSGATDCDVSPPADYGLTVDFPASSPYATAAGGTMFNEGNSTGATSYWNSNSSSSTSYAGSATGYIPEAVWNESSASGLGAGGGGASAYFTKPYWQIGTGVPSDFARDVPDVSFNAASGHDGYLFCSQGWCTNGFRNSAGNLDVVGGTSVAAPSLAGVVALLEQQLGGSSKRLGNINPMIYGLANSAYYGNVFHDTTSGNNSSTCQLGTSNCPSGGSIGYNATAGYDLATGWGSLDVANFVTKWSAVSPAGNATTVGSALSSVSVTTSNQLCGVASNTISVKVTVNNASGKALATPTGTVQIIVDNVALTDPGAVLSLSNGSASYTLPSSLTSGSHTISGVYLGDTNYAASKGYLTADIVSSTKPDFALTPCTSSVTARTGGTASGVTFTLTPVNGFTGAISLLASSNSDVSANYTFSPATITISGTSSATTSLVLTAYQTNAKTSGTLSARNDRRPTSPNAPWYIAGSGTALACVLFIGAPRRRRWTSLLALVLSVGAISASGCGGSSSSSTSSGGSTTTQTNASPGTYTINVTATTTSGTVHTTQLTFTVTQ